MRSAAILAGGRATRFGGRDKSALVVDGRPILDRQIDTLARVDGVGEILIVGGRVRHPAARSVADLVPDCGPLGGLHTALLATSADLLFVLACDMPYVPETLVNQLFEDAGGYDIVVPQTERGYHPLCAVYRRTCLDAVARRLAERRLKLSDLFEDVRTRMVPCAVHQWLANVNTPEEFAALHGHNEP